MRKRRKERERDGVGCGGLTSGDEIKRLTYKFDLENSFGPCTINPTLLLSALTLDVILVTIIPYRAGFR